MQYIWFMAIGRICKISILWHSLRKNPIVLYLNPVRKEMNFKYFRTHLNKLLQNACQSYVLSYGTVSFILLQSRAWDFSFTSYIQCFVPLLRKCTDWNEKWNKPVYLNISFQKMSSTLSISWEIYIFFLKLNLESNGFHKSHKHNYA